MEAIMSEYYLAIDIGASGGRHILGCLHNGKLQLEEVHRFENGMKWDGSHLVWDTKKLFEEICAGLSKCGSSGKKPKSMGIDTWGVDYILLDKNKNLIGKAYAYRDKRTDGMDAELDAVFPPEEMYRRTGIQKISINSIYQLMALKRHAPDELEAAAYFLMMPDYFHFLLTGEIANEYTNASTTQLIDVRSKSWDGELIEKIGINKDIFGTLSMPGTRIGSLKPELAGKIGFSCDVVLPATHDTGSAFMAVPSKGENNIYISSGTWSLMGCELTEPVTSPESMKLNYTNEGGFDYRYRYLKNIMGLWMIQSVRAELPKMPPYEELSAAACQSEADAVIDCNDNRFMAPASMIREIQDCCMEQGFHVPETPGDIAAVIYNSLAACYKRTFGELSELTGKKFDSIHIVGGGAKIRHLNRLTAQATGVPVLAGPGEATAIGNILAQMIADGVFTSLKEARQCVRESFEIDTY
jgi:rhamnulokinase